MPIVENNKEMVPFGHYTALYGKLDPLEASERCGVRYDEDAQAFSLRLLGTEYAVSWPKYAIRSCDANDFALANLPAQMLMIRYLLEGRRSISSGKFLPYREMPWGEVYLKPFTGRCLNRAAFTFGPHLDAFRTAAERLRGIPLDKGDASFQFEIMPGYDVRLIVWEGDDEFPPNSQMLFSDNFPQAFSAEDRTVVGDTLISDLKRRMK